MIQAEKLRVGMLCQFYNQYSNESLFLKLRTVTKPIEALDADTDKYLGVVTDIRCLFKYNTPFEKVKYEYDKGRGIKL